MPRAKTSTCLAEGSLRRHMARPVGQLQTSVGGDESQTRGVQQGKGFKYIPQPETKYKEVSDKLGEFQIKIKKLFVNSQKAYCVILKCTPPSRQQQKMDSWLNPSRKKNKLLVYLTDGDTGYEIGLCFSFQILFLT